MIDLQANATAHSREAARLLVDIGVLLLSAGAHTERTVRNLKRFAESFGYTPDIFISFSGITLTIHNDENSVTLFGKVKNHGVHLAMASAVSKLSWRTKRENLSLQEVREAVTAIKGMPHYPRWFILLMIGLGCGALARNAGADIPVVAVTALASCIALRARMQLAEWRLNPFLVVLGSAFVATLIGGLAGALHLGPTSGIAIAASVLFLIPGVPLINGVIDMINGHMSVGIGRTAMGSAISFALSGGMLLGLQVLGSSL
ncbi:threonine/serine exporter family protein [Sansalvadorimonas sp. 2012CJ34-2]|uniref:Threonine/serine exporter family protein n=1 Tax=Parendozoicomonas callyspongiae TaxID=2942213 RepID=A0ABT0PCM8_9GAMM|nr:threonine/serine exporter family protein [Sansalvadorimonas sp. 2012CJ34-2]MCL6269080.1 threonine/serine exporter family protein [Sansalvadorimonas sp. 2012CJ34-2]